MAHGNLGTSNLTANTNTTVYTATTSCLFSDVNIHISNNNNDNSTVSIAITSTPGSINASEWIENNITISNYGSYSLDNAKLSPGEAIVVKSSQGNVTVRVMGSEVTKR